jgi:hypothetical protein
MNPISQIIRKSIPVVSSHTELPNISEGFMRLVHLGHVDANDLAQTGFKYKGGVESNTIAWGSKGNIDYDVARKDHRFVNARDTVVMDVPIDEYKIHRNLTNRNIPYAPGIIPPERITGIIRRPDNAPVLSPRPIVLNPPRPVPPSINNTKSILDREIGNVWGVGAGVGTVASLYSPEMAVARQRQNRASEEALQDAPNPVEYLLPSKWGGGLFSAGIDLAVNHLVNKIMKK